MKRYRGENPAHTKWRRAQGSGFQPMKKCRKQEEQRTVTLTGTLPRYNEEAYLAAMLFGSPVVGTVVDSKEPMVYRQWQWTPGGTAHERVRTS